MTINDFNLMIEQAIKWLTEDARTNPELYTKGGESFEPLVVKAIRNSLSHLQMGDMVADVNYSEGSHGFPDIVIIGTDGSKYGVEVKSSTSKGNSWKINGNSVMGSTREPDIIKTVIIFGKLIKGNCQFRYRDYEDCVANVVVTHSPRYYIDLDLAEGETFFEKSKISYNTLTSAENPIELITNYFRNEGQTAWWLAQSSPAVIKVFREMPESEQAIYIGYAFAHFIEIFSSSSTKFSKYMYWLAMENSVIDACLRDKFTAGGRVKLIVSGKTYSDVPQVFNTLHKYRSNVISELTNADIDILAGHWEVEVSNVPLDVAGRIDKWLSIASNQIDNKDFKYNKLEFLRNILFDPS